MWIASAPYTFNVRRLLSAFYVSTKGPLTAQMLLGRAVMVESWNLLND